MNSLPPAELVRQNGKFQPFTAWQTTPPQSLALVQLALKYLRDLHVPHHLQPWAFPGLLEEWVTKVFSHSSFKI